MEGTDRTQPENMGGESLDSFLCHVGTSGFVYLPASLGSPTGGLML